MGSIHLCFLLWFGFVYLCQLNVIIHIGSPELGKQSKNKCEAKENRGTVIFIYRSLDTHIYRSMWCDWKVSGLNLFLCNCSDIYLLNSVVPFKVVFLGLHTGNSTLMPHLKHFVWCTV